MEGRRQRPVPLCSGGRRERTSGADEETKSAAGPRNPSGRKGSGGGEEWGCAGGVEEWETCSDKGRLFPSIDGTTLFIHRWYISFVKY